MNEYSQTTVDLALLKKYDKPGPRYTSYPTAPQFSPAFDAAKYSVEIAATNTPEHGSDISLYFHFPFCKTLCHFCACNVIITRSEARIERYLDYLKREIEMVSKQVNPARKVIQMHWGGGTPTYLSPLQIRQISAFIRDHFDFHDHAEVSIEIDPRRLTTDHLPAVRDSGFNRVSFGVQDFNEQVQETINRIQPDAQNEYVISESRRLEFDSVNVDLMYGLPYQTIDSYTQTLDRVIELSPDRLAVFNYAHVPWLKKHQNLLPVEAMPSPTERLSMLKMIIERLTADGYVYIGMDHFAKPNDELTRALEEGTLYRNFQGYSTYASAEVYAMGVTAISQLHTVYTQNVKTTREYEEAIDAGRLPTHRGFKLTDDDRLRRFVITEIMCNNRLLKKDVEARFGISFDSYFSDSISALEPFILDGLVSITDRSVLVSDAGRLVIRNIAMAFDAYLEKDRQNEKPIYSRTV